MDSSFSHCRAPWSLLRSGASGTGARRANKLALPNHVVKELPEQADLVGSFQAGPF